MTIRRFSRTRCWWLLAATVLMAACGRKGDDGRGVQPGGPRMALSIQIDGPSQVNELDRIVFRVRQIWTDGSSFDVTSFATLTSSNPSVMSIDGTTATALDAGEVGLTARFGQLTSQRKTVFVVPTVSKWNGAYTLTVDGSGCNGSLPLELRRRTYPAYVAQFGLTLGVSVSTFGQVAGRIFNPEARFYLTNTFRATNRGRIRPVRAYLTPPDTSIVEPLPDGNRLVIVGEAMTTMSPSGFTGTLNGAITLQGTTRNQLAVCSSPAHAFLLTRK
jgi:hypothetical protein